MKNGDVVMLTKSQPAYRLYAGDLGIVDAPDHWNGWPTVYFGKHTVLVTSNEVELL